MLSAEGLACSVTHNFPVFHRFRPPLSRTRLILLRQLLMADQVYREEVFRGQLDPESAHREVLFASARLAEYCKQILGVPVVVCYGSARNEHPVTKEPIGDAVISQLLYDFWYSAAPLKLGVLCGWADAGFMGESPLQRARAIKGLVNDLKLSPSKAKKLSRLNFGVPLNLKDRTKEPVLRLEGILAPEQGTFLTRTDFLCGGPGEPLAYFDMPGGFGSDEELYTGRVNHQTRKFVKTHWTPLDEFREKLGILTGDPRGHVYPIDFLLDQREPGGEGWFNDGRVLQLARQLRRGYVSACDLHRLQVIRVGEPEPFLGEDVLRNLPFPIVQYFPTTQAAATHLLTEISEVYRRREWVYEQTWLRREAKDGTVLLRRYKPELHLGSKRSVAAVA